MSSVSDETRACLTLAGRYVPPMAAQQGVAPRSLSPHAGDLTPCLDAPNEGTVGLVHDALKLGDPLVDAPL